jgi:hypothetical protein
MIEEKVLKDLYEKKKFSMKEISQKLKCSHTQVSYWMKHYKIKRRSRSESVYIKNNPKGDPFFFRNPKTFDEAILYGLGLGLYWGEGTKANNYSIRLGNTDPDLIVMFISFLETFFSIPKKELRFGIQIFSDMAPEQVLRFWCIKLKVSASQFMKTVVTKKRNKGSYSRKIEHGVLTIYFHNTRARNIIFSLIEKMRKSVYDI